MPVTVKIYNCVNGDGPSDRQNGFHTDSPSQTGRQKDQRSRSTVTVHVNRPLALKVIDTEGRDYLLKLIKQQFEPNLNHAKKTTELSPQWCDGFKINQSVRVSTPL